jgi:2'-5' RNA ligase
VFDGHLDGFENFVMTDFKIEYAANTSDWEYWQPEYLYGAFYVFPPAEVSNPINKLRKKFDPKSDKYCQTHISLSEPLRQPLTNHQISEIEETARNLKPFEMTYGPLITFPPHPGVCYAVSPRDKFFELRQNLHKCKAFEGGNFSRKDIAPHITIAEFGLTFEESEELRKELTGNVPEGNFLCDSIVYAVPNNEFYFEPRIRIPLGNS